MKKMLILMSMLLSSISFASITETVKEMDKLTKVHGKKFYSQESKTEVIESMFIHTKTLASKLFSTKLGKRGIVTGLNQFGSMCFFDTEAMKLVTFKKGLKYEGSYVSEYLWDGYKKDVVFNYSKKSLSVLSQRSGFWIRSLQGMFGVKEKQYFRLKAYRKFLRIKMTAEWNKMDDIFDFENFKSDSFTCIFK